MAPDLDALALRTQEVFARIHRDVFLGDPAANPRLHVEVVDPELVVDTPTLVLVTPWTLNGLLFPPDEDVAGDLTVGGRRLPVFRHELPELGPYRLVNLVGDVSQLANPGAARHAARVFGPPFREAVAQARDRGGVTDPSRRRLLPGLAGA